MLWPFLLFNQKSYEENFVGNEYCFEPYQSTQYIHPSSDKESKLTFFLKMIAPSSYNKLFELPMWETSSGGICKLLIEQETADFIMEFRRFLNSIYVHLWNYIQEQMLLTQWRKTQIVDLREQGATESPLSCSERGGLAPHKCSKNFVDFLIQFMCIYEIMIKNNCYWRNGGRLELWI